MASCQLRVFPHNEDETPRATPQEATVSISLRELTSVLRQAIKANYVWLRDFQDDEVRVTQDFYDVIRSFQSLRPSA
jgi:hypothetical protein